jgi:hypothetical protein
MLSDNELGAKVKAIFHLPIAWQGQSAAIQVLKRDCDSLPPEMVVGSRERNDMLKAKQQADRDTKKGTRTAPGIKPLPPRYVADEEPGPVDRGGKPIAAKKTSKKKATQKKA